MIEKQVTVETITIDRNGNLFVLLYLTITDNGSVVSRANHRTSVDPNVSVSDQFALVNTHLESMGWPPVSVSDLARLRRFHMIEGRG